MTLVEFKKQWPELPKDFQPFALEDDIKNFFEAFKKAASKDYYSDGGPREFIHVRAFFKNEENTLHAFGLFIGTHQGTAYEKWLNEIIGQEVLVSFTAAVFKLKWSFEGYHVRLLEISGAGKIAVMAPLLSGVPDYIYQNLPIFMKEERKVIYNELKAMKKRLKKSNGSFNRHDECHLYKELRKEFSLWPW